MKKILMVLAIILALVMLLSLSACGKEEPVNEMVVLTEVPIMAEPVNSTPEPTATPEPTPEPTPVPIQPELPPVVDEALNEILDSITADVQPGSAGSSLKAANCASKLLDWGTATNLTDDEIYSAVGCWLDEQSDERLLMFFESFYSVYTQSYNLRSDNAEALMLDAGISSANYPWGDEAAHAVEMVYYASGLR